MTPLYRKSGKKDDREGNKVVRTQEIPPKKSSVDSVIESRRFIPRTWHHASPSLASSLAHPPLLFAKYAALLTLLGIEPLQYRGISEFALLRSNRNGAKFMCSPQANIGKPPREEIVIHLNEARTEWRRRHPRM